MTAAPKPDVRRKIVLQLIVQRRKEISTLLPIALLSHIQADGFSPVRLPATVPEKAAVN